MSRSGSRTESRSTAGPVVGLVPARGGSVGIPRKSIAPLAGRPLLAYTAEAARTAASIDRVLLSTDDDEIASIGGQLGLEVPFRRPDALAAADAPMIEVIRHAYDWLQARGEGPAILVLLQPTSPLRGPQDIDSSVDLLRRTSAPTVVTVVEVPHNFAPPSALRMGPEARIEALADRPTPLLRQHKETFYARNGPAVLATWATTITGSVDLYPQGTRGLVMPKERSYDIDDPHDLEVVDLLLRTHRRGD